MANVSVVKTITDSMHSEIATVLGPNYSQLPYIYEIRKNNFKQSMSKYGARPLATTEINGVVKVTTHQHSFEVVLTEGYIESSIGDAKIQSTVFTMFENMNSIYKRLVNNKIALPNSVLNVTNIVISEPEILDEDKVLILRATIDILYRIEL